MDKDMIRFKESNGYGELNVYGQYVEICPR